MSADAPLPPGGAAASGRREAGRLAAFFGVDRRTLLPAIGSGLVVSIAILVPVVSYPSLVFSGPLQAYSGIGVGLGLITAFVLTVALVVGGSIGGTVAVAQSEPAVVMGVVAAMMAAELHDFGRPEQALPTILATILLASIAVGVTFLLLGVLRLGNLIRFVPYPLIVGFIGGMGWLLIGGAVRVATGLPLAIGSLPALVEPDVLVRWLPAVAAGGVLWLLQRLRPHARNVPLAAFAVVAAFWTVVTAVGLRPADLAAGGWMLSPIPPMGSWTPAYRFDALGGADWAVVLGHWPQIVTLVTVSLLGLLMQASVIEIAARSDIDLNRELRALGAGNVVAGMLGSLAGYHSLSTSLLAIRMGRPNRTTSLVVALVVALILCFGGSAVAYVPKLLIAALLCYVGLDVLLSALLNVHLRRAWAEFGVAMLVFATVAFVGLLEGLGVGVAAGVVLFVVKYGQVSVVRRAGSAKEHHSNVGRPPAARALLNEQGDRVLILELQGYIFFGTSALLVNRIRARVAGRRGVRPGFVLLDFRRVTGIDSSVSLSLGKLARYAEAFGFVLVATGLTTALRAPFERLAREEGAGGRVRLFADLDHGLEFCENRLLAGAAAAAGPGGDGLEQRLRRCGGSDAEIAALMRWVERKTYRKGDPLIRQGEASRDLFFVESGAVTVRLVMPDGRTLRLRTMGAGTVVGEVAVYLQQPRSASVVAATETTVARLGVDALAAMRDADPAALALLHAFMARELSEKLLAATQQLAAGQG